MASCATTAASRRYDDDRRWSASFGPHRRPPQPTARAGKSSGHACTRAPCPGAAASRLRPPLVANGPGQSLRRVRGGVRHRDGFAGRPPVRRWRGLAEKHRDNHDTSGSAAVKPATTTPAARSATSPKPHIRRAIFLLRRDTPPRSPLRWRRAGQARAALAFWHLLRGGGGKHLVFMLRC